MKLWVKILLGTVIGFAGGFAAGFLTHKKMNDIQFEEISEEEMKEIEEKIQSSKEKTKEIHEEISKTFEKATDDDIPEDPDKLRNALQGKTPYIEADKDRKMQYEKMWKATKEYSNEENADQIPTEPKEDKDIPGPEEEEFDEEFLEMIESEEVEAGNAFVDPPHVITLSDFYNDRPEFDKITIEWFEPDNVWLDEKEEIIADISSYIGMTNVSELFKKNDPGDDPDVRFVRNEQYGTDYEIIRHHRSWKEMTGGVE